MISLIYKTEKKVTNKIFRELGTFLSQGWWNTATSCPGNLGNLSTLEILKFQLKFKILDIKKHSKHKSDSKAFSKSWHCQGGGDKKAPFRLLSKECSGASSGKFHSSRVWPRIGLGCLKKGTLPGHRTALFSFSQDMKYHSALVDT